jgi:hypothetical protein
MSNSLAARTAARPATERTSVRDWSTSWLARPVFGPTERASLHGLQVQESSFGEWLSAGGDRRVTKRTSS